MFKGSPEEQYKDHKTARLTKADSGRSGCEEMKNWRKKEQMAEGSV